MRAGWKGSIQTTLALLRVPSRERAGPRRPNQSSYRQR